MLDELLQKLNEPYTKEDLAILEEQEKRLVFEHFTSQDAYLLGQYIIKNSEKYKEGIAFNIQRCSDQAIIFQYIDDNKAQRNINFAQMKRNTTLCTNHNSFWSLVKSSIDQKVPLKEECLPVGGAYPIFVGNEMVATIALSGLHYGNDFRLLVESLAMYLEKKVPEFKKEIL
ncbi:MAG: heme-binding protein [Bacillota bacterium]|nr:heme-binding protein [Bacillota bacterium]